MPSYSQTALNYKVLNGNAVSILIGDTVVGFGQTSSPTIDYGTEPLYGVGSARPQEIQQLRFSMSITLDYFKLTAEGQAFFGETTPLSVILANNSFNIFLVDNAGTAFLSYVGCVASNDSTQISANAVVAQNVSFLAMDVLDSNGNSVLNSNSALLLNFVASAAGGSGSTPTAP